MLRDDHDAGGGKLSDDRASGSQAVHPWHLDIDQSPVGLMGRESFHRFDAITAFDHFDIRGGKKIPHGLPEGRVVINHQIFLSAARRWPLIHDTASLEPDNHQENGGTRTKRPRMNAQKTG